MKLSIIIVSWNTKELLAQCLRSIVAHPPRHDFETWVVDNRSSDGSAEMVRQEFPAVKLIENKTNVGFARANNQAIEQASGETILLLNPDTEILPDALDKLVRFMDRNPRAGAVGPRVLNPDGTLQTSCYPFPTLTKEFWRLFHLDRIKTFGIYDMSRWEKDAVRQVDVLQGACLALRKSALDQVGLLDENYFMYTEEVDLCLRLSNDRWDLFWVPAASIIHYGGQSTQQIAEEMFLHLYQSKLRYFKKNYGNWAYWGYKAILMFASIVRLVFSPLVWFERDPTREKHLKLARNYRRLLRVLPSL